MGLSRESVGMHAADTKLFIKKKTEKDYVVALAGNPNVGKSTVFNAMTGLRQHTGNWPGKTVASAQGYSSYNGQGYVWVDVPGCYSLLPHSAEEEVAGEFICSGIPDAVVVVCDAVCLERNLHLVLQIMEKTKKVVVCVNLMDEAAKKHIRIDLNKLEQRLGVPVVGTAARNGVGIESIYRAVDRVCRPDTEDRKERKEGPETEKEEQSENRRKTEAKEPAAESYVRAAERICRGAVIFEDEAYAGKDRRMDKIFTGRLTGFPIMLVLLLGIFWLTILGANYPSELLHKGLFYLETPLMRLCIWIGLPEPLGEALVYGMYRVTAWVISVMLPPMAIFFPLFTLLEDSGYLPRVAFNLDKCFRKCSACGKQALTMCMGFGCNAAGVIGSRIIDSPRERLIAVITNNFVPCNGRFPTLIVLISIFFVGSQRGLLGSLSAAALLLGFILFGICMTLAVSKLLSSTLLKGLPSSFALELPPYRRPQIGKVIVRSVFDRTAFVLGRAMVSAVPAGIVIWLLSNLRIQDVTILSRLADFLEPLARIMGMDGVILLAFILGFPANEIVIPIMLMAYMASGSLLEINNIQFLRNILTEHGWTWVRAVNVMLFSLMHWPCATTCLTIYKETGSVKWTALSCLIPTLIGIICCIMFTFLAGIH